MTARRDTLRLGTRRSALAMAQSELVAQALRAHGQQVELVGVTTEGDRSARAGEPLVEAGGLGVFAVELRTRLLAGDVDLVVHSMKDLPTAQPERLVIAAVPARADARDALVSRERLTLDALPAGAVVGTSAPRRAAQLLAVRPDLQVRNIRGNVDTRIAKVQAGEYDAVVVAAAGLARLGRLDEASQVFAAEVMLPAPAQGALAIECRAGDTDLREVLAVLDDPASHASAIAERALLAELEAGCAAPIGALAESVSGGRGAPADLRLTAVVVSVDGTTAIRRTMSGPAGQADRLGRRLAAQLLADGAAGSIRTTTAFTQGAARGSATPVSKP